MIEVIEVREGEFCNDLHQARLSNGFIAHYVVDEDGVQVAEIEDHGECVYFSRSLAEIDDIERAIELFIAPLDK